MKYGKHVVSLFEQCVPADFFKRMPAHWNAQDPANFRVIYGHIPIVNIDPGWGEHDSIIRAPATFDENQSNNHPPSIGPMLKRLEKNHYRFLEELRLKYI